MRDLTTLDFHPTTEKIIDVVCKKTQNHNPLFFRVLVNYHLTKLASMMRVSIVTQDRGKIPINMYAINLGNSGLGKGHATNIIEDELINGFREEFFDSTYPVISKKSLNTLATKRANIKAEDPEETLMSVEKEFDLLGTMPFSFDSGTTAAVKQMRHKLLMANIGSMNLEIDEIGSNLLGNIDVLGTFLELFDMGKVKQKLIKNTRESVRNEEIQGRTPTNLLCFGTPTKLLDGSKIEEEFDSFLNTGYARRSVFGHTRNGTKFDNLTAEEIYDILVDPTITTYLKDMSAQLGQLAHIANYNKSLLVSKAVSITIIKYRMHCEALAATFGEHEDTRKAEMEHRYFKATKVAGMYAFIDGATQITEDHFYNAVKFIEESGASFTKILKRERNYTKLAKYIASVPHELTGVDLTEDLPFYRGSASQKNDLMQLAIAWGYKNHIIIKRSMNNNIEFVQGEALQETNLDKLVLAFSSSMTTGYKNQYAPYDKLHRLTQLPGKHWVNHHVTDEYRDDEHIIAGFNMVVLDIDDGVSIQTVQLLLKDYKYMLYTTKRHTTGSNRFRIVMPINYFISLNAAEYKEFMSNLFEWLPFTVDTQTGQRSRKWLTCDTGTYEYSPGDKLLDALLFIPKTAKNDERKQLVQSQQSLTNLERWFVQNIDLGNRNNQLLRYALILVDMGYDIENIRTSLIELNKKLDPKLTKAEMESTILTTVAKKIIERGD